MFLAVLADVFTSVYTLCLLVITCWWDTEPTPQVEFVFLNDVKNKTLHQKHPEEADTNSYV